MRGSRILGFGLGVTEVFPKSVCHIKLRGLLGTGHGVVSHFGLAESYIAGAGLSILRILLPLLSSGSLIAETRLAAGELALAGRNCCLYKFKNVAVHSVWFGRR